MERMDFMVMNVLEGTLLNVLTCGFEMAAEEQQVNIDISKPEGLSSPPSDLA